MGSRVAAKFSSSSLPGAGRGILGASASTFQPANAPLQEAELPVGRGRGRGLLSLNE